jgi:hypothetical protein
MLTRSGTSTSKCSAPALEALANCGLKLTSRLVLRRGCEPVGDPDESQQRLALVPMK